MSRHVFLDPGRMVFDLSRGSPRQNSKNSPGSSNSLLFCRFPVRLEVKNHSGNKESVEDVSAHQAIIYEPIDSAYNQRFS